MNSFCYHPFMDYSKIIIIEPGKRSGKPAVRGTRMTVTDVLEYLAGGMSEAEILSDFPDLYGWISRRVWRLRLTASVNSLPSSNMKLLFDQNLSPPKFIFGYALVICTVKRTEVFLRSANSIWKCNAQRQSERHWYREAVMSQSPGLLQPWVRAHPSQPGTGCASLTQPRCG